MELDSIPLSTFPNPLSETESVSPFADNWKLTVRGDVGGFGVGSDLAIQGWATVDWFPWRNVGFIAGLRGLDVDYKAGSGDSVDLNLQVWGPLAGVTFRW